MVLSDIYIQDIQRTISLISVPNWNNAYLPISAITTDSQPSTYLSGKLPINDLVTLSYSMALSKITPQFILDNIFDWGGNIKASIVNDKIQLNYQASTPSQRCHQSVKDRISRLQRELDDLKRIIE